MHTTYGTIETLAPLHIGATAGEENGNLNLIFRDPHTQTGVIPGSSIRGRFRAEMRLQNSKEAANYWYGHDGKVDENDTNKTKNTPNNEVNKTTQSKIKFEHASILWLPIFCPGKSLVWVSCPRLLKRYKRIAKIEASIPFLASNDDSCIASNSLNLTAIQNDQKEKLFFSFGFLTIKEKQDLSVWFPDREERPAVIVKDDEIGMVHDMALFRQTRTKLGDSEKTIENFFNVEALPPETILVFPVAAQTKQHMTDWPAFNSDPSENSCDLYFGGLESIGYGHCSTKLHR